MKDNTAFIDSNLIIYLYSVDETEKKNVILGLFDQNCVLKISDQVINEVSNILLKKVRLFNFGFKKDFSGTTK